MKTASFFLKKYLENRPMFYAFIRPQEAMIFYNHQSLIRSPSLDFGCGDGFFAKLVFGNKVIDTGLDLKNSRIDQAKNVYKKMVTYDGKNIPYPTNYFRSIISNCVLEHLPHLEMSLKEIYRVLKPNGYFLTTVMTDTWEKYIFGKKFMRKIQKHHSLLSHQNWQKIFLKNGFSFVEKIGYLSPIMARYNELFHYLSLPSLVSYKLVGRWVLFPHVLARPSIIGTLKRRIVQPVELSSSAAVFFVLKKLV